VTLHIIIVYSYHRGVSCIQMCKHTGDEPPDVKISTICCGAFTP
jgi:hypothetical protein